MATVGGLSSGTSSGVNMYGASMKGFGGLASGMDTDSMIEGMTLGTRTKIQDMLKKKERYQWQTDAYRSVSNQLIDLSKKYLNIASSESPYRASFFDKSLATASGSNSGFVSVTGPGSLLDRMKILGVSSMAKDASLVTKTQKSEATFSTGDINFNNDLIESKLEGGTMTLKYGDETFDIVMKSGVPLKKADGTSFNADYTTPEKVAASINAQLRELKLKDGTKLDSKVQFTGKGGEAFSFKEIGMLGDAKLSIVKGSESQMKLMGFMDEDGKLVNDGKLTGDSFTADKVAMKADLQTVTQFEKRMAGKTMTFSYNGISKRINLPTESEWKTIVEGNYEDKNGAKISDKTKALADFMQQKLDKAFGTGKVKVDGDATKGLTFGTVGTDKSAVFKLVDTDTDVLGEKSLFKDLQYGAGNRLNLTAGLEKSGLVGLAGDTSWYEKTYDGDKLYMEINGVEIKGLTKDSSISAIMNAINQSDAGVKVSYLETADAFTITSTVKGESGSINFNTVANDKGVTNFAAKLFGTGTTDYTKTDGQDATMKVQYEGGVVVDVKRDSNSFNLDGTTFTINGTFSTTDKDGKPIADSDPISFTTSVDTEKVSKTIKTMIEDYNKIIENVQGLVSQKPDRDYGPLTDDEKAALSESQIEKLEKKAKEGILFNDPILRSLSDKLRTVFSGVADVGTLKEMGITVGGSYKDGGKVEFDETKFKAALQSDPEKVKTLFTKASTKEDGGGFTVRLKDITDTFAKYEGSTKGLLIDKAGSSYSATSLLKNSLKTLMDEIDEDVKGLQKRLQTELDRYTKQFSSLEQLVAQMNNQSSQLSQLMGG